MRNTEVAANPTVLWLVPGDAADFSPLAERLAEAYRVVSLTVSSTNTRALLATAAQLGQFVLIAQSSSAEAAIALARNAGVECTALILLAPERAPRSRAESAPDVPTLLLLGTDDARLPPSEAAALCAGLPRAHPILIYGAGHALDRERVEAVAAVICDFIARPDKFIVRVASDLLFP